MQNILEGACRKLGISSKRMPSGAGHDVAVVSDVVKPDGNRIETGLIFIPCKDGVSHNPDESAELEDIAAGAEVLRAALIQLASD